MIRPTLPDDTKPLVAMTEATAMFRPIEIEALQEVLDDYHASNASAGHFCFSFEEAGQILGFAYIGEAAMTDRSWYLWWIVVAPAAQGKGIGGKLLLHCESVIRNHRGRHLFIETGSMGHYEQTRQFYIKHGYTHEATLTDFYAEGDSMVIFRKAF